MKKKTKADKIQAGDSKPVLSKYAAKIRQQEIRGGYVLVRRERVYRNRTVAMGESS
jgi:hypothetical protein